MLASLFTKVAFKRVLPYIIGLIAIGVIGWLIYDNGYDDGVADTEAKYQTKIVEERHRQIEANQGAFEKALRRQEELELLLDQRDETIRQLFKEGEADPDAGNRAINADSVRRINRVR
jgi:hypothetical protein